MEKRKRKIVGAMVQRWMNHWRLYSLSWHYIWSSVYTNENKFVRKGLVNVDLGYGIVIEQLSGIFTEFCF
jgi:hypothetical protein